MKHNGDVENTGERMDHDGSAMAPLDFRRLFESIPGLYLVLTPDFKIVAASDRYLAATMTRRGDLLGRHIFDAFPDNPEDPSADGVRNLRASLERVLRTKAADTMPIQKYDVQRPAEKGGGFEERYWSPINSPVLGEGGEVAFIIHRVEDVTGERRAELALKESEERFRALMEQAPFSVQLFSPDGRTLRVNRAWEDLWGVRFEQIEKYNILEDRQLEEKGVLHFIRQGFSGQAARIPAIEYDPNETIPDITHHEDPRRWLTAVIYPLKDGDGKVREVVLVHEDITAQKKAEEELRQSRGRLSADLSAMSQLHDLSHRLLACHDLNTALYEVLDAAIGLMGAAYGNIQLHDPNSGTLEIAAQRGFGPDFLSHFQTVRTDDEAACGRAMRSGRRVIIHDVQADPAFEPHREAAAAAGYRAVQSTPLWSRKGELLGMLSTHFRLPHSPSERDLGVLDLYARQAADFIERLQIEEALREADRRKDEFLATLAHELRNPLAPIRNGLEVMRLSNGDPRTADKALAVMERQLGQMVRLVDDLLDLSRISRGAIELRRSPVELAAVVQQAVEISRPLIEAAGHELTVVVPHDSTHVDADETRLSQIYSNLLNNSAKYTPPGGRITLCVRRNSDEAVVSVKDSGIGIPADMLPKVFDMFTQVDRNLHRSQGGLGIGLSIVKRLVEMHGGRIEAHSEGVGRGSEFIVRLPAVPTPRPEHNPPSGETNTGPRHGLRILVADDNVDAAQSLAALLALMGQEVRTAYDGQSAVVAADDFQPQLVLLDIGMPKLDGYEVAAVIRSRPWAEAAVLVALTGWGQEADRRRAEAAGFDRHFTKPVDPEALKSLLALACERT